MNLVSQLEVVIPEIPWTAAFQGQLFLGLKEVSKKLSLDTKVIQEDVFKSTKLKSGTILARAFKPLPVVLDLVHTNFSNYNNLIMFMGKNGKQILKEASKNWDFEYKQKRSITSEDSFLLNIKNIKKKWTKLKLYL